MARRSTVTPAEGVQHVRELQQAMPLVEMGGEPVERNDRLRMKHCLAYKRDCRDKFTVSEELQEHNLVTSQ